MMCLYGYSLILLSAVACLPMPRHLQHLHLCLPLLPLPDRQTDRQVSIRIPRTIDDIKNNNNKKAKKKNV